MSLSKQQSNSLALWDKAGKKDVRKLPPPPINNYMYHESRYKIEMCRHYDELRACHFGDRCLFAHGEHEMRPCTFRHPLWRTKLCRLFAGTGFCVYGNRCAFIHSKPVLERELERLDCICRNRPIPMPENPVSRQMVSVKLDMSTVLVRQANLSENYMPSAQHLDWKYGANRVSVRNNFDRLSIHDITSNSDSE